MQIIDKNMARTGGNPDFGTKYKFDFGNEEVRSQALTIRVTPSFLEEIKNVAGDRYRDFCRDAIVEKLGREMAAQTATKTETTEPETVTGQQLEGNQTTQEAQEPETNPTPREQGENPKRRRKANQTQAQKPVKPKSQTRSRKSSVTEKPQEQG
jgi:hypothetical protein